MSTVVAFETLPELFLNLKEKYEGTPKTAFARKPTTDADYEKIGWDQVSDDVYTMAAFLVNNGIEVGDRVGILSENRYEWAIVDLALQLIGGINVSLYSTLPAKKCEYILTNSEAKMFFVSTGIQLKKAREVFDDCDELEQIIAFDEPNIKSYLDESYVSLYEKAMAEGLKTFPKLEDEIQKRSKSRSPEDMATLIYTSGTTGQPKGAVLTQRNIVSNIKAAHQLININDDDRCLSFLPLCHSFERTAGHYAMMAGGAEIYYAESVDTVAKNMPEAKPTIIISVPRLFEKIYNLVKKSIEEGTAIKKKIFNWAQKVGKKYAEGQRGLVSLQKELADSLVFNKLKQRTGGRIRFFVSGGAALPPKIGEFFMAAGLNIIEGYGLTETSPIMCCNTLGNEKIGTVGKVLPGISVAIQRLEDGKVLTSVDGEEYPTNESSEQGEILCKGPNVMKGYWKNDEATRKVIDDDRYFHTGDVGKFVNGKLKITDRIKHMIVNAGGKNIYPGPIEDLFKTSKWIDQLVVVGESQPYMASLIVPDFDALEKYAGQNGISYNSVSGLLEKDEVQNIFSKEIRSYYSELASHEKIRDFRLLDEEFTVESGEITPTMKIKRRIVEDKYCDLIEEMFSE